MRAKAQSRRQAEEELIKLVKSELPKTVTLILVALTDPCDRARPRTRIALEKRTRELNAKLPESLQLTKTEVRRGLKLLERELREYLKTKKSRIPQILLRRLEICYGSLSGALYTVCELYKRGEVPFNNLNGDRAVIHSEAFPCE